MSVDLRREAVEILQRFVRGEATTLDLDAAARRLEVSSVAELCENLSSAHGGCLHLDLELRHIARQLARFLEGRVAREESSLWVSCLHAVISSAAVRSADAGLESAGTSHASIGPTLRLLSLLLDRGHSAPLIKVRSAILRVRKILEAGRPVPLRSFLPSVFRDMGSMRFRVLDNPLAFSPEHRDCWLDVGITSTVDDEVRLIPFSVFTREFFLRELPELVSGFATPLSGISAQGEVERARSDRFYYHPENNQAISLKERFPPLRSSPIRFQYFIDETGLAEIVLDSRGIGREEVRFAAKLFCLQNGVRRATLDGRRVSCTATAR